MEKTTCLLGIRCSSSTTFGRWLAGNGVRGGHASQLLDLQELGVILRRGLWQGQQFPGKPVSNGTQVQGDLAKSTQRPCVLTDGANLGAWWGKISGVGLVLAKESRAEKGRSQGR